MKVELKNKIDQSFLAFYNNYVQSKNIYLQEIKKTNLENSCDPQIKKINKNTIYITELVNILSPCFPLYSKQEISYNLSLLFSKINADVKNNAKYELRNFGTFYLKKQKPKKFYDARKKIISVSKSSQATNFKFSKKQKQILNNN